MVKTKKTRRKVRHGQWSSGWVFVLAAGGAVIGLNNVWEFPYYAGQYGGGAFLIVYLASLLILGLPLLMTQITLGRLGRSSPIFSIKTLIERSGSEPSWVALGWIITLTGFLVLSYLSVIAGWTLAYCLRAAAGSFGGLTADGVNGIFTAFVSDPEKQIFWHSLFMVMTMVVVARGVKSGFEPVVKLVTPLLMVLLAALLAYAVAAKEIGPALVHLFYPDFSRLSNEALLIALGHAFFSLGLGFGAMMVYGAYLPARTSVGAVSLMVIILDILVGLLAAGFIYAVLLAGGEAVTEGPELIFQAVPLALDSLPLSRPVGALFFLLLGLAAWLTAIALIEPAVAWLLERWGLSRFNAAILCGLGAWTLGVVTILSFNYWKFDFEFLGPRSLGFFDALQILTSNFLLPLSGMFVALFAGWSLDRELVRKALALRPRYVFLLWLWSVRLVVPVLLLVLMVAISRLFL